MTRAIRNLLILPLVAALGLVLAAAFTQAFARGGGPNPAKFVLLHGADLQLTTDQIARIEALKSGRKEAARSRHENIRAHREALMRLMRREKFDRAEAQKQIDGLVQATSDQRRARLEAMLDLSEILTVAQRGKLREIRRENRSRRAPGHRRPFGPPAGAPQSP
ncbi:MAG: Spy/CpxP family protein refolding chaperone [Myxococcota bacterium]